MVFWAICNDGSAVCFAVKDGRASFREVRLVLKTIGRLSRGHEDGSKTSGPLEPAGSVRPEHGCGVRNATEEGGRGRSRPVPNG